VGFLYITQKILRWWNKVQLTGSITEYYNFTELTSFNQLSGLSQGNPLPAPTVVTSGP
jgi:predicted extracellular nuclease